MAEKPDCLETQTAARIRYTKGAESIIMVVNHLAMPSICLCILHHMYHKPFILFLFFTIHQDA